MTRRINLCYSTGPWLPEGAGPAATRSWRIPRRIYTQSGRLSRVDNDIQALATLLMAGFMIHAYLIRCFLGHNLPFHTRTHSNPSRRGQVYEPYMCARIVLNLTLSVAIFAIFLSVMNRISTRSRAPLPPPPPPKLVPAWSLGTVAETKEYKQNVDFVLYGKTARLVSEVSINVNSMLRFNTEEMERTPDTSN
ncbi:hypothetical protein B0H14DRAFT_2575480 [Mycena olivaceomarginata]|nr:hypothetical protein B0H14DRAFT_2575480 [Mycena olivaceomarginata]